MKFSETFLSRKQSVILALGLIVLGGFLLRVWNFDSWLYFKMDQARDAMLISRAVEEGASFLPLLGPRVGAVDLSNGLLRVGPMYYYFQYVFGIFFQSTEPSVFAYPDLFFGTLAIPMLYMFARLMLPVTTSLGVATLLAVSFLGIEYSRFAWNPNPLPFFLLLSFYGLLRFFREEESKKRFLWVAIWALGGSVAIQLHFFGTFSLLGISGVVFLWHYQAWRREVVRRFLSREKMIPFVQYVTTALLVFATLSTPLLVNDFVRDGENVRNFFEALVAKPDGKHSIAEKVVKASEQGMRSWCLISTSFCVSEKIERGGVPLFATMFLFLAMIVATVSRYRCARVTKERDFLRLLGVWVVVFFILSIPVAFQLRPRFSLVILVVPFLLWGVLFEYLRARWARRGMLVGGIIFALLLGSNLFGTLSWFREQSLSQTSDVDIARTLILKTKDGVTLGQLRRATEGMTASLLPGERIFFFTKPEHASPITYLLRQEAKKTRAFLFEELRTLKEVVWKDPRSRFFAVVPVGQEDLSSVEKKFGVPVRIRSFVPVGQIAVAEFSFVGFESDPSFSSDIPIPDKSERSVSDRVFWGDIFGRNSSSQKDQSSIEREIDAESLEEEAGDDR